MSSEDARFAFGANWLRFLERVDESRVTAAMQSLQQMLDVEDLQGKRFLDVGCGSGLFSLAAHRLGARVHAFDYDPQSVACTREIRRRFQNETGPAWSIEQGSVLDEQYLSQLEPADITYAWGVLHHTGAMWKAIGLVADRVAPGGLFWIAIYNDQGPVTRRWIQVKQLYQRLPSLFRPALVATVGGVLLTHRAAAAAASSLCALLTGNNPFAPAGDLSRRIQQSDPRGMSRWHDLVDWVGGWPFEVARPEDIIAYLGDRGLQLVKLKTVGGKMGCNEFLFKRSDSP